MSVVGSASHFVFEMLTTCSLLYFLLAQFGFGLGFTTAYILSPKFCHRFVGYVEEEACSTYTKIIKAIENAEDGTELAAWKTQAPPQIAVAYWKLGKEGTVLDLMKAVRADEAEHRYVERGQISTDRHLFIYPTLN